MKINKSKLLNTNFFKSITIEYFIMKHPKNLTDCKIGSSQLKAIVGGSDEPEKAPGLDIGY